MGNLWTGEKEKYNLEPRKSVRIEVQRQGEKGLVYEKDFMPNSDAIERIKGDLFTEV